MVLNVDIGRSYVLFSVHCVQAILVSIQHVDDCVVLLCFIIYCVYDVYCLP
jgi:hypothetical protein